MNNKRVKLFEAMQRAGVDGEIHTAMSGPVYHFAMAVNRLLQNKFEARLSKFKSVDESHQAVRAILTTYAAENPEEAAFVQQVLAFADEDAKRTTWPMAPLNLTEPAMDVVGVNEPVLPTLTCGTLSIVMPFSRFALVDIKTLLNGGTTIVQRDCLYHTLLVLRGLRARGVPPTDDDRRAFVVKQLRAKWPQALAAEEKARAELLKKLETGPATWNNHVVVADAELADAEAAVAKAIAQGDAARVERDTPFATDDEEERRAMQAEWIQICERSRQLWARALSNARAAVAVKRAAAEEARVRLATNTAGIQAQMEELRAPLPTMDDIQKLILAQLEGQITRLGVVRAWPDACDDWFNAMLSHTDILADAHLTAAARTHGMLCTAARANHARA
jgi:hypothetical protein